MTKTSEYMNQKEAMNYLGFSSVYALNEMINNGLPYYVVGKSKRYSKRAIDEFMDQHKVSKTATRETAVVK
ncbi:Putative uncharacterized protein [Lactobacillus equicursoris 66c]|uniref:Helix-turn-helix domain-containing protein n=1 Tax=Lactobacillus equicursoris 66c TaxID=872326 RepID=K0NUF8_9LACO|nr:helix-turn-helix domain-containing protein [Lactobacillus equicursoris]CCK82915.1 Putative uncharacterized protein [Lactobacillus equicursoris 66c]